ncbi:MAG: chromosome segregation protein SMC [Myxococcales bacterium]|nr:chromosome segregation protein SMC [Myxococcales bacterium]
MHIKRLEIAGFKSFVDRTVIHFDHDVIGVVGPNGCGKSNIVDAIRWCMGEQSAKHLRGRAMEDVIFNGSESRGPHGLAEVTITFDNNDPTYAESLPPEYQAYPEIAITRRLYRDGTSEYLINKTQVRLRDVTELFLGTGVGTKAYSIVEQGRIGQIVSSRPEDRRLYIEEAAGITKYKQRRRQAERKMELTRQNLLRINDIVSEIDRTRASLKRQVAKAERYVQYRGELEDLVLHDASHKLLEYIVTEHVERGAHAESSTGLEQARTSLGLAESELEAARHEAVGIEQRSDRASTSAFEADNEVTALGAEIERARDRMAHLDDRQKAAETEQEEITRRLSELGAERESLADRLRDLARDEGERVADAEREDVALAELKSEEARANETLQGVRNSLADISAKTAADEARVEAHGHNITELEARRDRLGSERDSITDELAELDAKKHALERSLAELAEGKRLTVAEREALEAEIIELRAHQLESERAVDAAKNELGLKKSRLKALDEVHRRLEGVGAGARALVNGARPGVLGLVADRIEAPVELTAAFAGLLGERLQYVVVDELPRGLDLLAELAKDSRGRANIIAARPPYVAGAARSAAAHEPGVLGYLSDRLAYAPVDEALVCALVGDALLVETAEQAVALAERFVGTTAVALDGTVARPDGVVSGGSGDDVAAAMVEQKRELRVLAEEVERLTEHYGRVHDEHTALRARLSEVGTSLDRARQEAHAGELAHVTAEKDVARTTDEMARANARQATIGLEATELETKLTDARSAETDTRAGLEAARVALEHLRHELAKAEASATSWNERVSAQANLVTERRVRLAQVREQVEAAKSSELRVLSALTDFQTRAQRLADDLIETARALGETAAQIVIAREARVGAAERAREAHKELESARALLEQVRFALGTREADLKTLRDQSQAQDEAVRRAEMALQRIELEREHLLANVRDRFRGLDLRRVVGDYHARPMPDDEQRRRIEELTQLIDRMGPVNLDAGREWQDAEKRFHDLSTQKIDIEKALEDLERAIKHMNRESRRRFKETFDAVNDLFKKTFTRMFRGGRAELALTNPDDMLDTGVDIIAQPPGKKLGNIELMSGGEKALTAVSLIFAIFQYRPSPFCVLDEVDAPLDEANVTRYNEAIQSMTANSQFILITHVRKTMQSVDVLYGVTMGEPGVSRIVSVKVNDQATVRSEHRAGALSDMPPAAAIDDSARVA